MKQEITPFNYNGRSLSTITDEHGEIWFIAKEVAEILEYTDAYEMTKRLDDDEKLNRRIAGAGQRREMTLINESGLYASILNCTKPEAKPFKKWVTSEVLPTIRKTGRYEAKKPVEPKEPSGLDKLRLANAVEKMAGVAERLCAQFPRLGDNSRQVIYAKLINPVVGDEVICLPRVIENLLPAGKIGELLGVSGNMIGRLANKHGLKTEEYGEFRLDKSAHSSKQVEVFHYNGKAVDILRGLVSGEGA